MRRVLLSFSGCALFTFAAFAGGNGNATSADQQWQSLKGKGDPITSPSSDAASVTQAIATYIANADALKTFYTQNPTHADAKEAKRLETLALLYAESLGDKSQRGRCKQLVKDLRGDATIDLELREQLAAFSDNLDTQEQTPVASQRLAAFEQTARALQAEFPGSVSIYDSLNGIAASSADDRAAIIAKDILAMPAPDQQKARAQILLSRLALKGTSLTTIADAVLGAGNAIDAAAGHPVILYTWSTSAPQSIGLIKQLATSLPADTAFIGVCLDIGDLVTARARAASDQPLGTQLYDPMGFIGKLAGRLQLTSPGLIYLADRQGKILNVSGQLDTTALTTSAANL